MGLYQEDIPFITTDRIGPTDLYVHKGILRAASLTLTQVSSVGELLFARLYLGYDPPSITSVITMLASGTIGINQTISWNGRLPMKGNYMIFCGGSCNLANVTARLSFYTG